MYAYLKSPGTRPAEAAAKAALAMRDDLSAALGARCKS
jgi:hypothetical protein